MLESKKVSGSRLSSEKALDGTSTGLEVREVGLSAFCLDAAIRLGARGGAAGGTAAAVRAYLDPARERRFGWRVPEFQRGTVATSAATIEVSLELRDWAWLEAEAAHQGVSEQQLIRHAVTYAAAQGDRTASRRP